MGSVLEKSRTSDETRPKLVLADAVDQARLVHEYLHSSMEWSRYLELERALQAKLAEIQELIDQIESERNSGQR